MITENPQYRLISKLTLIGGHDAVNVADRVAVGSAVRGAAKDIPNGS